MDQCLSRMEQRAEEAKKQRAKTIAAEKAAFEARKQLLRQDEPAAREKPGNLQEVESEALEESEEQRIFREFMEYEMESPHHDSLCLHTESSTPAKETCR